MVILWPLCRSHQLICPPAIQATLHWQSPATAPICLVPTIPRTPSRPLRRCPSCKALSCNRCPTASCRVTPVSGTLRTSTNLSPLCPVGPGWSHYRRLLRFWSHAYVRCWCTQPAGGARPPGPIFSPISSSFFRLLLVTWLIAPAWVSSCHRKTISHFLLPASETGCLKMQLFIYFFPLWVSPGNLHSCFYHYGIFYILKSVSPPSFFFTELMQTPTSSFLPFSLPPAYLSITGFGCFSFSGPWPLWHWMPWTSLTPLNHISNPPVSV